MPTTSANDGRSAASFEQHLLSTVTSVAGAPAG
eukprot:CAMPEP_0198337924 /NCGR_PEP_ID=MMETSP1450-20131203/31522_1 /TAXON_ID=753684 ORGANISM="Madagascaria erythrocladiodes, Strain CCMP3234" /NCGR_SAMPLE_ID=MMETSP1450 /ASSEMBLY_ACC=CAM_ASM_001115 /LENGTH=32 /DNA_ID= /DNA_START= /DNA_END= /DNA_ORIENTATION=